MINDDLYDLLLDYCKKMKTKIIFIADDKQIQPVNNGGISKVFNNSNIIRLTKIFRQSNINALTDLLIELRNNVVTDFHDSEDGSIKVYYDTTSFVKNVLSDIKKIMSTKDLNYSKLICYTNKRIDSYNKCIRKLLYKDTKPYHIGEILIGCENYSYGKNEFYNSSDYIVTNINEYTGYIPQVGNIPGFKLSLYDGEKEQDVFIIDINKYTNLEYIGIVIEATRMDAVQAKGKARFLKWKKYYELMNSFATPINITYDNRVVKSRTFNYGYALSAHRS